MRARAGGHAARAEHGRPFFDARARTCVRFFSRIAHMDERRSGARVGPTDTPQFAGLTSARDIARRQETANRAFDAAARRSSLRGLTLRTALEDMREVIVSVPAELRGDGPISLSTALLRSDRLRGLGLWLIVFALVHVAFA